MEVSTGKSQSSTLRMSVLFSALLFIVVSSIAAAEGIAIRIDTHAHFLPPFYSDLLIAKGHTAGGVPVPKWSAADHLAFKNSMGIQLSILSVSTPGARFTLSDVEEGRKLARQLNEYAHILTVTYPERFQFLATLTLPDVEGSIAEAIYSLDTLKAAGVSLMANAQGQYLGSRQFDPLMELLDAREATVFVHPSQLDLIPVTNDMGGGKRMTISPSVIDFLLDTTRAAQNLIVTNVTRRYPKIKFILAHSGGFLPFAAYRMAAPLSAMLGESQPTFMKEIRRFYVDTALSSSPTALPSTLAAIPHDHITFGSDYPYAPTHGIKMATKSLDEYLAGLGNGADVNFHSANSLFEKTLSHWRSVWHQDTDPSPKFAAL